MHKKVAEAG